jgi:hypothetical protein
MDLSITVIFLNDLIVAVAFFTIGFFVSESNKSQLFKRKPKPPKQTRKVEDNPYPKVDKEDIMNKIRAARGQ